jgi:hypothetical protein
MPATHAVFVLTGGQWQAADVRQRVELQTIRGRFSPDYGRDSTAHLPSSTWALRLCGIVYIHMRPCTCSSAVFVMARSPPPKIRLHRTQPWKGWMSGKGGGGDILAASVWFVGTANATWSTATWAANLPSQVSSQVVLWSLGGGRRVETLALYGRSPCAAWVSAHWSCTVRSEVISHREAKEAFQRRR